MGADRTAQEAWAWHPPTRYGWTRWVGEKGEHGETSTGAARCRAEPAPHHVWRSLRPSTAVRFRSGPNPAEGCLVTTRARDRQGHETTTWFLFRFGATVAVDEGAQRAAPSLPVAGVAAHAIAGELEQYPGQVFTAMPLGMLG